MSRILVCIPVKPKLNPVLREKCVAAASRLAGANPDHKIQIWFDDRPVPPLSIDSTPWSKVARARNRMLDEIDLDALDYLLWIDADIVDYPADMPTRLIAANPTSVSAPMVLIEGGTRFYDYAAFIQSGCDQIEPANRSLIPARNLRHDPPYWSSASIGNVIEMDCVGSVTMVPASLYSSGTRYVDHPAFTDHYSICKACRDAGGKVVVCRDAVAYHADLPKYPGESWH